MSTYHNLAGWRNKSALTRSAFYTTHAPLTFTRNFAWVVVFCVATLLTVPLLLGWIAGILLN